MYTFALSFSLSLRMCRFIGGFPRAEYIERVEMEITRAPLRRYNPIIPTIQESRWSSWDT